MPVSEASDALIVLQLRSMLATVEVAGDGEQPIATELRAAIALVSPAARREAARTICPDLVSAPVVVVGRIRSALDDLAPVEVVAAFLDLRGCCCRVLTLDELATAADRILPGFGPGVVHAARQQQAIATTAEIGAMAEVLIELARARGLDRLAAKLIRSARS